MPVSAGGRLKRLGPHRTPKPEFFYWEFCEAFRAEQAVRMGPWKAYREHPERPTELYAVDEDPGEEHNVASEHPDVTRRMEELFQQEHEQSEVFPDPGEEAGAWHERMQRQARRLPDNLNL